MYSLSATDAIPMDEEKSRLFMQLCLCDIQKPIEIKQGTLDEHGMKFDELPFGVKIVLRRIEVMHLPLKMTVATLMAFALFPDRAGAAVLMLIDLLENYADRDEPVTIEDLGNTYPMGFYNEKALEARIDAIKADKARPQEERKFKFSYVY